MEGSGRRTLRQIAGIQLRQSGRASGGNHEYNNRRFGEKEIIQI